MRGSAAVHIHNAPNNFLLKRLIIISLKNDPEFSTAHGRAWRVRPNEIFVKGIGIGD
jgi:hypothetical protein